MDFIIKEILYFIIFFIAAFTMIKCKHHGYKEKEYWIILACILASYCLGKYS